MNKQTEKKQRLAIYQQITSYLIELNTPLQIKTSIWFKENDVNFDITIFNRKQDHNRSFYFFMHDSINDISAYLKGMLESIKTNDYEAIKKQAAPQWTAPKNNA